MLKSDAATDLIAAVEAMQNNYSFFNSRVDDMVLNGYLKFVSHPAANYIGRGLYSLTSRERQILELIAQGRTTKEAALDLGVSVKTAETYRANINRKLNVHSTGELVLYAVRNHVVPYPTASSFDRR